MGRTSAKTVPARTVLRIVLLLLCAGVQIGKRQEEERDMARYALRNPWWTLSNFDATRKATALQGDAKSVHWQLSEAATAASTASVTGFNYKEPKTGQEVGGLDMASPLGFPLLFISFPFYYFYYYFDIIIILV